MNLVHIGSLAALLGLVTAEAVVAGLPKTKSTGSLEVVEVTPQDGAPVDRDSTITARLRFSIDNFQDKKGRYAISINFQDVQSRSRTFAASEDDALMLKEASGTVKLSCPLAKIWDDARLRKPLVVYFYLHEFTGKRESVVLYSTEGVRYSVRDPASSAADEAATELLLVMDVERMMMGGASAMTDSIIQDNAGLAPYRDVILEWAGKVMTWDALAPKLVTMYTESFTESELRDLAAFYRTPAGRKALSVMPELMRRGAMLGSQVANEHMDELQEMLQKRAEQLEKQPPQP
ncbi:MAG TPA: DUF2059 domain-containing protein [Candidatus Cryosericum sp.]|nr:DUF2059 domain-containing protein [Candidatus Cryosericum sp.]